MNKTKTAGHFEDEGVYDIIAYEEYYLDSDEDGRHIYVVSPSGDAVAEICVHSLTPTVKLYSNNTSEQTITEEER